MTAEFNCRKEIIYRYAEFKFDMCNNWNEQWIEKSNTLKIIRSELRCEGITAQKEIRKIKLAVLGMLYSTTKH